MPIRKAWYELYPYQKFSNTTVLTQWQNNSGLLPTSLSLTCQGTGLGDHLRRLLGERGRSVSPESWLLQTLCCYQRQHCQEEKIVDGYQKKMENRQQQKIEEGQQQLGNSGFYFVVNCKIKSRSGLGVRLGLGMRPSFTDFAHSSQITIVSKPKLLQQCWVTIVMSLKCCLWVN